MLDSLSGVYDLNFNISKTSNNIPPSLRERASFILNNDEIKTRPFLATNYGTDLGARVRKDSSIVISEYCRLYNNNILGFEISVDDVYQELLSQNFSESLLKNTY